MEAGYEAAVIEFIISICNVFVELFKIDFHQLDELVQACLIITAPLCYITASRGQYARVILSRRISCTQKLITSLHTRCLCYFVLSTQHFLLSIILM